MADSAHGRDDDTEESAESALWSRRIRVGWLIPIAVGAVLLGTVGTWGGTGQFDRETQPETPTPASTAIGSMVDTNIVGELDAADTWFVRPFQASDTFPEPSQLEFYGIGEHNIRLALDGGDLGGAWVGHTLGKLCLIIANADEGSSAANCVERNWFTTQGVSVGMGGLSASWYGNHVTTDPPIDPMPRVSPPDSGNVDAANAWFDQPATEDDRYPVGGLLDQMGVDQSQVRLPNPEQRGPKVWLVKQGTRGFCLAGDEASVDRGQGKGDWNCSTIDEFEAHGVTLATQNFAAAWDGEALWMSSKP